MLRRSDALALSLVLGAGSVIGLHAGVRGQTRPPTPVPVVAVTRAVGATESQSAADLRVVDLPPQAGAGGGHPDAVPGRRLYHSRRPGTGAVSAPGRSHRHTPPRRLREGQAAYTLPLTTPAARVEIPAGDRVTVIAVLTDSVGTAPVKPDAIPVLEARILAVEGAQGVSAQTPPSGGLQLTAGSAGPQALQLAVTPKQAKTLAWYQQHATLTVAGDPWGVVRRPGSSVAAWWLRSETRGNGGCRTR